MIDIGELIIGAYLKVIKECDVVDYNVRTNDGGMEGLGELDVLGFNFEKSTVYLCEVTTHLQGINYGNYEKTIQKVHDKYKRQQEYAKKYLKNFDNHIFMYWTPRVPVGKLTKVFSEINGLEFIMNEEYTEKIEVLKLEAKKTTKDTGNQFFRTLQILEHLKKRKK